MAQLYLECGMGAAGDMLCAALYELLEPKDREAFLKTMNGLDLPRVKVEARTEQKCGIQGTRMVVIIGDQEEASLDAAGDVQTPARTHSQDSCYPHNQEPCHQYEQALAQAHHHQHEPKPDRDHGAESRHHDHAHAGLDHIRTVIDAMALPQRVKENAQGVYALLGRAEAQAHGRPMEHIHFHEVGTLDAIADIVGFCLLMDMLYIEKVTASPLHVGSGHVKTSHGILPVPAPATAYILQGIPTYSDGTRGELVTPTGAALIKHFASGFGPMPMLAYDKIGYGMGRKSFEAVNCVRAFLYPSQEPTIAHDTIVELRCTIDDMTPEAMGYAIDVLLVEGARDVHVQPVTMKKSRPGFELVCLCSHGDEERMAALIFKHTTTLGVRKIICERYLLERRVEEAETTLGKIRIKRAQGYGVSRAKPEYDDVARAAKDHGMSFREAYQAILRAIEP